MKLCKHPKYIFLNHSFHTKSICISTISGYINYTPQALSPFLPIYANSAVMNSWDRTSIGIFLLTLMKVPQVAHVFCPRSCVSSSRHVGFSHGAVLCRETVCCMRWKRYKLLILFLHCSTHVEAAKGPKFSTCMRASKQKGWTLGWY